MQAEISKILIVDDDEQIVNLIETALEHEGFKIQSAYDGRKAILVEDQFHPDLVILDINIPFINGFEVLNTLRQKRTGTEYLPIIFISGVLAEKRAISGLELGADDFIRKPFDPKELVARVRNLLKLKRLITSVESMENVLFTMVKSVQVRDFYTAGHSHRVGEIGQKIGKELKLTKEELNTLHKGAMLHDIGKIGISDNILNKPGRLLPAEFEKIKEHPVRGVEICNCLHFGVEVLNIVRHHHEKLDGSGYPDGLKETHINKLVRIIGVADIYDALTTKRPYHPARKPEEALSILRQEAKAGKIDSGMVDILETIVKREQEEQRKREEQEEREQQQQQRQ